MLESRTFGATVCDYLENDSTSDTIRLADGGKGPARVLSHEELLTRAHAAALTLRAAGVAYGDRVFTLLPTSAEFLVTLFGAWYAGGAIVPAPSTSGEGSGRLARRLRAMLEISRPRAIVGTRETLAILAELGAATHGARIIEVSDLMSASARASEPPSRPRGSDVALLQFTSGSTGLPRGAVIRHDQIVGNALAIGRSAAITAKDTVLSWLPLYHDMGFIGGLACPLVWGVPLHLMPTEAFVRNPASWLRAFASPGATVSPTAPFALDLLAFRVGERRLEGIDLSSWRYAWIGSEPIFAETLRAFRKRFAPYGLREDALKPCYGLAEATLAVTTTSASDGPDQAVRIAREALREKGRIELTDVGDVDGLEVVTVGASVEGAEIDLRDAAGGSVGEAREGRIFVRGPWVTSGYFATEDSPVTDGWLDTGDLGFFLGGELHITGRLKDVIKRGGVSIQPQDLEWAAGSVAGIRRGQTAAFSTLNPDKRREQIVVLAESRVRDQQDRLELADTVRRRIAVEAGVQVDVVDVVPPGSIPHTSSGKVQRDHARRMYQEDGFAELPLRVRTKTA